MPSLEKAASARGEARVVQHSSAARFLPRGEIAFGKQHLERSKAGSLGGDAGTCGFMMAFALSGQSHRYAHSKLANAVFGMALHDKLALTSSRVKSLVAEPGGAMTSLLANGWQVKDASEPDGKMKFSAFKTMFDYVVGPNLQSGPDGACSIIMACFAEDAKSGDFFCPSKCVPPKIGLYMPGCLSSQLWAACPSRKVAKKKW